MAEQSQICKARQPHSHPNQRTEAKLKLICDMRRNLDMSMAEL